jgi:hypothetical protein
VPWILEQVCGLHPSFCLGKRLDGALDIAEAVAAVFPFAVAGLVAVLDFGGVKLALDALVGEDAYGHVAIFRPLRHHQICC